MAPVDASGGALFSVQPVIAVLDVGGNTVSTAAASIQLSIHSGPSRGALAGTLNVPVVNGLAVFTDVSLDIAGGCSVLDSMLYELSACFVISTWG